MNLKNLCDFSIGIRHQEWFVFFDESRFKQLWVQLFPFFLTFYSSRICRHKETVEITTAIEVTCGFSGFQCWIFLFVLNFTSCTLSNP